MCHVLGLYVPLTQTYSDSPFFRDLVSVPISLWFGTTMPRPLYTALFPLVLTTETSDVGRNQQISSSLPRSTGSRSLRSSSTLYYRRSTTHDIRIQFLKSKMTLTLSFRDPSFRSRLFVVARTQNPLRKTDNQTFSLIIPDSHLRSS